MKRIMFLYALYSIFNFNKAIGSEDKFFNFSELPICEFGAGCNNAKILASAGDQVCQFGQDDHVGTIINSVASLQMTAMKSGETCNSTILYEYTPEPENYSINYVSDDGLSYIFNGKEYPKRHFSTSSKLQGSIAAYCSSCDHIVATDEESATDKYLCIVNIHGKLPELREVDYKLRQQLISENLANMSYANFKRIFRYFSGRHIVFGSEMPAFFMFYRDFRNRIKDFNDFLVKLITEEVKPYFASINCPRLNDVPFFHHRHSYNAISVLLSENGPTDSLSWNSLIELKTYIETQKREPQIQFPLYDFYIRMYLKYIFRLESEEFKLLVLKIDSKNQTSKIALDQAEFIKMLDSLSIESSAKDQILAEYSKATGTNTTELVSLLIGKLIELSHNRTESAKLSFRNSIKEITSENSDYGFLEVYNHILNLDGDQILRVVSNAISRTPSSEINKILKKGLFPIYDNFKSILAGKIEANENVLKTISELQQKGQTVSFENLIASVNTYNVDTFLIMFGGSSLDKGKSQDLLLQIIKITNDSVFQPFKIKSENSLKIIKESSEN